MEEIIKRVVDTSMTASENPSVNVGRQGADTKRHQQLMAFNGGKPSIEAAKI